MTAHFTPDSTTHFKSDKGAQLRGSKFFFELPREKELKSEKLTTNKDK